MQGAVIPIRRVDATQTPTPPRPDASVVFGAFASLAKLGGRCLATWRRILDAVPGSVLAFSPWREWEREYYVRRTRCLDIETSRLRFLPATQSEHVDRARYRGVDIALDAFPYSGGDSAATALAEGVPLVTLCGRRHAERVATSILTHLGVADTIAHSEDDYVDIAVALARDSGRRAVLVERIRGALPADTAAAMDGYTRHFEDALERAVQQARTTA